MKVSLKLLKLTGNGITVSSSERSGINYTSMISMIVRLSIRRGPSVFMNFAMRERYIPYNQSF